MLIRWRCEARENVLEGEGPDVEAGRVDGPERPLPGLFPG